MTEARLLRILLVDDHPLVREGLLACLTGHGRHEVVGEASDGREALELAARLKPDVVLMDISMPVLNGIQSTALLRKRMPEAKVILLTMHDNREYIVEGMRAGAHGYVLKDAAPQELLQAVEAVTRGERYFSASIPSALVETCLRGEPGPAPALSRRETEVLRLIADGLSNKEAAARLDVSVRTIEKHRERIMRKLDIHSAAGLTKYAILHGLTKVN
ncbi:MAG: response regulator transcription factor [Planctomycetota bacterium]|nr:response regulator transcription factor [Planctomycetota bacterium]